MSEVTWLTHQSGLLYRRGRKDGQLLYQIKGADRWIDEQDFRRCCDANAREIPRAARYHESGVDHQGPLRAPRPHDNRLFPADGDDQEGQRRQSQTGETSENYELRSRDGRMLQEDPAAAREGPARITNHGNMSTLASRTKSTDTRSVSQQLSRSPDSRDLPERPIQAQPSRLSALSRSFIDLGLGNYLECSHFIANNPKILAQNEIEALMAEALIAERAGQSTKAQICIHQALLLRKCNEVGLKNNSSFFRELNAKDSRTRESFVMDVKKVYDSIQKQVGRASEQRQGSNPEPQNRKSAVMVPSIERTVSQNSYRYTQNSEENIQYPEEVGLGRNGKTYHKDIKGNLSLPANSGHDPERHRSRSDPTQLTGSAQGAPGEASLANSHSRYVGGRFKRSPASDPAGSLPTLPEHFKYESTRIEGTAGSVEKLDERYYMRTDAKSFFRRGRVFALLWHESAGGGGGGANGKRIHTELSDPIAVRGRFGEQVYSHIRRMVVVKEDHGFCLCLPINTYNGQGVTKSGLSEHDRQAHSIIYMTDTQPYCLPEEENDLLINKPIAVEKASRDQKLDRMSRLNFKKIYTVEHNVKVMDVGKVTKDSLPTLIGYWRSSLE